MRVLSVAYPFAPVTEDPVGGAEQILSQLDRALIERGHESFVVAQSGSQTGGELIELQTPQSEIGPAEKHAAYQEYRRLIDAAMRRVQPDVVHMHGVDFYEYLPNNPAIPVLVTLHLPIAWYPYDALQPRRNVYFQCVSYSQAATCPDRVRLTATIPNGVAANPVRVTKRNYALFLGRICPEKGIHHAIEACRQAQVPLIIAGQVFPYATHVEYFENQLRPQLGPDVKFLGPVGGRRKQRLLAGAKCLLAPSEVAETCSLVSLEALASGTPVVAFESGELPYIVRPGINGFLARNAKEMAFGIGRCDEIDSQTCRHFVARHYSYSRMLDGYFDVYARLAGARSRAYAS